MLEELKVVISHGLTCAVKVCGAAWPLRGKKYSGPPWVAEIILEITPLPPGWTNGSKSLEATPPKATRGERYSKLCRPQTGFAALMHGPLPGRQDANATLASLPTPPM